MPDIFISYSTKNKVRVERLAKALEHEGFKLWWDRHLEPGQSFRPMIQQQLDAAKCVVVVWTAHSILSKWVLQESSKALTREALIPILLEPVTLPMPFGEIQNSDLSHWKGEQDDPAFQTLVQTLRRKIAAAKANAENEPNNPTTLDTQQTTITSDDNDDKDTPVTPSAEPTPLFIQRHWKASLLGLGTLIMTTFGVAGGILDLRQWYDELFVIPALSIEYSPQRDLQPNESFSLTYQVPNKGHISLWQLTPNQPAIRRLPPTIMNTLSVDSKPLTDPMRFGIPYTGTSRFVLLWTPDQHPQHLSYPDYDNTDSFETALTVLRRQTKVTTAQTDVTIIPKSE